MCRKTGEELALLMRELGKQESGKKYTGESGFLVKACLDKITEEFNARSSEFEQQ